MIGMVGTPYLSKTGTMWEGIRFGNGYRLQECIDNKWIEDLHPVLEGVLEAEAVDGLLIATQYDIPWREDILKGWDFYDVSQSLEFRREGYKVGVVFQEKPWCMHDCGISKLINYDVSRKKILEEYKEFFPDKFVSSYDAELFSLQEKIFRELKRNIEQKNFRKALQIKAMLGKTKIENNPLQYALNLMEIYEEETRENLQSAGFFDGIDTWEEMKEKYDTVKFMLRHMHQDMESHEAKELLELIENRTLSPEAVMCIARHCV